MQITLLLCEDTFVAKGRRFTSDVIQSAVLGLMGIPVLRTGSQLVVFQTASVAPSGGVTLYMSSEEVTSGVLCCPALYKNC